VRQDWDGEAIMGERCRVYFGQPTPVTNQQDLHLALPDTGKLFFISPPPSPPHGWEQKMEDAPNKMVHADDLADALARLRHHHNTTAGLTGGMMVSPAESGTGPQRSRSSTLVFQPNAANGASPDLPCVIVHDMTGELEDLSPAEAAKPVEELVLDA
jgi:hypothetical protein